MDKCDTTKNFEGNITKQVGGLWECSKEALAGCFEIQNSGRHPIYEICGCKKWLHSKTVLEHLKQNARIGQPQEDDNFSFQQFHFAVEYQHMNFDG